MVSFSKCVLEIFVKLSVKGVGETLEALILDQIPQLGKIIAGAIFPGQLRDRGE